MRIAVPDQDLAIQLSDLAGATVVQWAPDSASPIDHVDLLVLPYMVGPEYLTHLIGKPVTVVQSQMLGYENVDQYLPESMTYCNAVDVHEAATAELAAALILSCERGLSDFRDAQKEGRWDHRTTRGLSGANIAIIGAGGVGEKVADVLSPFGVSISQVARRARHNRHGAVHPISELGAILRASDIVVIAVPLTAETRHLVDGRFLSQMPDGSLLVNVSRGPVVDSNALLAELTAGRLRAALDVTDPEPLPADHALWRAPGVTISPHVGGDTSARLPKIGKIVREQVRRLQTGEPLLNVVVDSTSS